MKTRVFKDQTVPVTWRVESEVTGDGGVEVEAAVFSGPNARARAIDYARYRFGDFDEIELEPY